MWMSLIGFMGSGKSTVAGILARRSFMPAVDLDALIVERAGRTIPEIFERGGEQEFRRLESEALASLPLGGDGVLACGGGLVIAERNRRLLRERGTVVWLDLSWESLRARLERDGTGKRPLADGLGWDGLEELYRRRRPIYAATAHFRIRADRNDEESVAQQVLACRLPGPGPGEGVA